MSKLFLSITFITICLISNITSAGSNSLGGGASAKHRAQVDVVPSLSNSDASPQPSTNTGKYGSGFSEAKRAAGSGKHKAQVDAAPQSNTNTDKHGSGFSEAKRAAGSGKY